MPRRTNINTGYICENFAASLRQYRENAKIAQRTFAQELGLSNQRYNRYETQGAQPDIELLIKIAKKFQISVDELIGYKSGNYYLDTACKLLESAGNSVSFKTAKSGKDGFLIESNDGRKANLDDDTLIKLVFNAKKQVDSTLKSSLNTIFINFFQHTFWEAIKKNLYNKNEFNQFELFTSCDTDAPKFSDRLRYFREMKNFSQTKFSSMLGLTMQAYNRYEKNNAQPSIALLMKMASTIGISVNKLVGGYIPSLFDHICHFMPKVQIKCLTDNGKFLLFCPMADVTKTDEDGFFNIEPTYEKIEMSENEIAYYINYAKEIATKEIGASLDHIFSTTFQPLFWQSVKKKSAVKSATMSKKDSEPYLYQQEWYNDGSMYNTYFHINLSSTKSKIIPIEEAEKTFDISY